MARRDDVKIELTPEELDIIKSNEYKRGHDVGIEIGKEHTASSPETKSMFEKMTDEITRHIESDREQHKKLDEKNDLIIKNQEEQGRKLDEMYQVYTASGFTGKIVIKIFATIGIITGAIIGTIELLKRLK